MRLWPTLPVKNVQIRSAQHVTVENALLIVRFIAPSDLDAINVTPLCETFAMS